MRSTGRARRGLALALVLLGCVLAALWLARGAPASSSSPTIYVFPIPGGKVASPQAQLTFRGVPASQLGTIQVTGSQSGSHTGTVVADPDGQGASLIPSQPFTPGEVVTVTTGLNIAGATNGTYQFAVARPAPPFVTHPYPAAGRVRGDVWRFRTRPDLVPAAVTLLKRSSRTAPGDIFLAAEFGPVQEGPEIIDGNGNLVWFKQVPGRKWVADFRVQRYQGQPVLTWWQGYIGSGAGRGQDVINDSAYHQIAVVSAGNGLSADLHDFEITRSNTALITADYPVYWDARSVGGTSHQVVMDSVAQEIDIPTGLVLFQWDSLDHVPVSDSYVTPAQAPGFPYDFFHINSIEADYDGNVILSARNTWAAYKVDHQTAATIWILGGKRSSFKMGPGAQFAFQHDLRVHASGDQILTVYDNGAGAFKVHPQARGLKLQLDTAHMTATAVTQFQHSPALQSTHEGNLQELPNMDEFVGWGQPPYFTEFDSGGHQLLDGRFVGVNPSYGVWRFVWNGSPQTRPAVAAQKGHRGTTVWASWNGATGVASWRVLSGSGQRSLRAVGGAAKRGFETLMTVRAQRFIAVQALDRRGRVLATSKTVAVR